MRLRFKSLLIMGVVLLVLFSIVLFSGLSLIAMQMEKNQSESDLMRATGIINNIDIEAEAMSYGVREYSWWGATEQYVKGGNPTFFDLELNMSSLINMRIDLVTVLYANG